MSEEIEDAKEQSYLKKIREIAQKAKEMPDWKREGWAILDKPTLVASQANEGETNETISLKRHG